jgi:hypothetical protein
MEERKMRQQFGAKSAVTAVAVLSFLALTGCATRQEVVARHQAVCTGYGFDAKTSDFSNCLLQLDIAERRVPCQRAYLLDYFVDDGCPIRPAGRQSQRAQ